MTLASEPRPDSRAALRETLGRETDTFRTRVRDLLDSHSHVPAEKTRTRREIRRRLDTDPEAVTFDGWEEIDRHSRPLAWQAWVLDHAPLGITLTGAAYHDNQIRYANLAFQELTGYGPATLSGANPRFLQTEETDEERRADFVEALRTWEPVTVEIHNERADGRPFSNRVSLVPVAGADGTVEHWFGIQAVVAWPAGRP